MTTAATPVHSLELISVGRYASDQSMRNLGSIAVLLAGWPTLKAFDVSLVDVVNLPPEATEIALAVAKISEPGVRREVTDAILIMMKKYFTE